MGRARPMIGRSAGMVMLSVLVRDLDAEFRRLGYKDSTMVCRASAKSVIA